MVPQDSILVVLVMLVDRIPMPPLPPRRKRGRPIIDADRLFLKAVVLMMVRHLPTVPALLAVLEEPAMRPVRALLYEL